MQECRATVRYECAERAQYCSAKDLKDLIMRDGRLTTLTERGLGLLAHEPHHVGERLTVSFALPGEPGALTTTGVVRWTSHTPTQRRWYPLGIEWSTLEETTRFRLDTFLRNQGQRQRQGSWTDPDRSQGRGWKPRLARWSTVAFLSVGLATTSLSLVFLLHQENTHLGDVVQQRNLAIAQIGHAEGRLRQALEETTTRLTDALSQVAQLTHQTNQSQGQMQQLRQEVERFQAAYATLREEREQLVHQLLDLKQEHLQVGEASSAIPLWR